MTDVGFVLEVQQLPAYVYHQPGLASFYKKLDWSEMMKFRMQPLRAALALGFVLTTVLVSGCDINAKVDFSDERGGTFAIMNPVIRTPMAGRPTAGYFDFNYNYKVPDQIISVASPEFKRVEMHDSITDGGMKKMVKLDTLDLPAKSAIKFAPGGKHLMLFEPTKELKDGDQVKVTFVFAEQNPMVITFDVRDVVPITGTEESMDHSRMDHSKMDHGAMNHGD
ncbi:MAG: copper chaperone PCu(A)C, partial [Aquidulcibacter sp.]|nr:copper chaperone PCu(A)C [Aquidulcibacter sp.]